eukprot:gene1454-1796_t
MAPTGFNLLGNLPTTSSSTETEETEETEESEYETDDEGDYLELSSLHSQPPSVVTGGSSSSAEAQKAPSPGLKPGFFGADWEALADVISLAGTIPYSDGVSLGEVIKGLVGLFKESPHLIKATKNQEFARFMGWPNNMLLEDMLNSLQWRVAIYCSMSEAKALAQLLPVDLREPCCWVKLTSKRLPGENYVEALMMDDNRIFLWEELIRQDGHKRWDTLAAAIDSTVLSAFNEPGLRPPASMILHQLLQYEAPTSAFATILSAMKCGQDGPLLGDYANQEQGFFWPPVLIAQAIGRRKKSALQEKTYRPDVLGKAVTDGRADVVQLLVEHFRWAGVLMPMAYAETAAAARSSWVCMDMLVPVGWEFRSSGIWLAAKQGKDDMLVMMLDSLSRAGKGFLKQHREGIENTSRKSGRNHSFAELDFFLPDMPLHLEALIEGHTPLMLAVKSCNLKAAAALIKAGADPYIMCLPLSYSPNNATAPSSAKQKVPWTTPMHTAVEKGLVSMLNHLLEADSDVVFMQSYEGFPPAETLSKPLPPSDPDVHRPLMPQPRSMFDSNGDTPLTLAVRLRQQKAAIVLLQRTGMSPLFCVNYAGKGRWEHALLMAAKADPPLDAFLQCFKPAAGGPRLPVNWKQQLGEVLEPKLHSEDIAFLVQWLSKQQVVVDSLAGDLITFRSMLHEFSDAIDTQPGVLNLLVACSSASGIFSSTDTGRQMLLSTFTSLMIKVLKEDSADVLPVLLDMPAVSQGLLQPGLLSATLGTDADKLLKIHPHQAAVVAAHLPRLLELGLPPFCRVRVISDVESLWQHNLLHAAAALQDFNSRLEAVAAVANKAAEQGWTDVFTMKSTRKQLPSAVCKNDRIKKIIREAEAAAKQAAAAKAKAAQKATAARTAAANEGQQVGGPATDDTDASSPAAKRHKLCAADAAGTTGTMPAEGGGSGSEKDAEHEQQQQQKAASKLQPTPEKQVETDKQRRQRLSKLLFQIPAAVQATAAPSPSVVAAAAAAAGKPQLSASQQAARDTAIVKGRIAVIAPEQLPDKDVAMGAGVLPGAAAAAAATSKQQAAEWETQMELDRELECEDDDEVQEEDVLQETGTEIGEHSLESLPWEFVITAEGLKDWLRLEERERRLVLLKLRRIGEGLWQADGSSKRIRTEEPGLELWRTKITKGGRIIWQVAVDFSQERKAWMDMIRVWCIHMRHDDYDRALSGRSATLATIVASHKRSQQVRKRLKLQQQQPQATHAWGTNLAASFGPGGAVLERLPGTYKPLLSAEDDEDVVAGVLPEVAGGSDATAIELGRIRAAAAAAATAADKRASPGAGGRKDEKKQNTEAAGLVDHLPPANGAEDVYTLLKTYTISSTLLRAVLRGQGEDEVDFPFRVSEAELRIIEAIPRPPASMLLLGRSGTGKTTVLVFRLFGAWLSKYQHSEGHLQAVFVTASATLKEQVSRTFRKLQAAAITDPQDAAAVAAATAAEPTSLINLAPAAFPIFTTTRQWLKLLDASCSGQQFFAPGLVSDQLGGEDEIEDWDGIGVGVNLQGWTDDEDEDDNESDDEAEDEDFSEEESDNDDDEELDDNITYSEFVSPEWWKRMTRGLSKDERTLLKAPLVYQEVMSYIKGSAEAMEAGGSLNLEQYLEVGRKRAPNFAKEVRPLVYRCYQAYEAAKADFTLNQGLPGKGPRWDRADLAAHLYRQLAQGQYRGARLDGMYRDEVQDFTQAELLLDLRVCADPNSMFYCGDTCQTIARGIGFRFEDVKTLMYREGCRHAAEGGVPVGMPHLELLTVNYRTHSGILDAASSITALLRSCFPMLLDKLPRERAFFTGKWLPAATHTRQVEPCEPSGPRPLLLDALSTEDLSILLSSGDPGASQVEFGAHQVVLVRDMEAREQLPAELKASNALIMTVGQSKGLEFDDVFLVDFCADSPAGPDWRVLLHLLQSYEDTAKEIAKYVVASGKGSGNSTRIGNGKQSWQDAFNQLTAGELRLAVAAARQSRIPDGLAGAAVALADKDKLLQDLPSSATLSGAFYGVGAAVGDAGEAGGWLRPLEFKPEQHSLLCEELKHLYVAVTRAKNNLVIFDRDPQKRAPLYHFLRRLSLATHITTVAGGLGTAAAAAVGSESRAAQPNKDASGMFRGSMSNTPKEWAKRARNLVEMKLFKLAAQCYACAGDLMRAAAYGAMQQLHDLHTSAQEAAGAISSSNTSSAAASVRSIGSRSYAADQQPVESPVAPPLTPLEQLAWLKLAANAFKAAGWVLEAGQLLLGLGPELDGGKWLAVARKLLKSAANKSGVALMYEQAARQELGLGRISHPGAKASTNSRGAVDDAANAGAHDASQAEQTEPADDQAAAAKAYAMAVGLGGMHGSFLTASKLLREALAMYQADEKWADCWRLVNEYEGLRQTLKKEQCDNITLNWIALCHQQGNRSAMLEATSTLSVDERESVLRRYGFWKELAATARNTTEAARLLAQHGEFQAAAERCLADSSYMERATGPQLKQVHGWLLRVGTTQAARQAVAMWEGLQQQGRLTEDIAEGHALAQLNLARLLLRATVGEESPSVSSSQQPNPASSKREKEKDKRKEKASLPHPKEQGGRLQMHQPVENFEHDIHTPASKSYAAAAATAGQLSSAGTTGAAAAPGNKAASDVAASSLGPLPTAALAGLQQQITQQPDYQAQVEEALRTLAEAQQTFINYNQHAGAFEALSWMLAAKSRDGITVSRRQLSAGDGAREPDIVVALQGAKHVLQLLQALGEACCTAG